MNGGNDVDGKLKSLLDAEQNVKVGEDQQVDKVGAYFKLAMSEVFCIEHPDARSHVNDTQINAYAVGRAISRHFGSIPIVDDLIDRKLILAYSRGRGSRNEMREIAIGVPNQEDPDKKLERMQMSSLFGGRR
jgi:hypothetical protein